MEGRMVVLSVQGQGRIIQSSESVHKVCGASDSRAKTCWVGKIQSHRGLEKNILKKGKERCVQIQRWVPWRTERASVPWARMLAVEVK